MTPYPRPSVRAATSTCGRAPDVVRTWRRWSSWWVRSGSSGVARERRWTNQQNAAPTSLTSNRRRTMKIVVIGGTGLIGSKAVPILRQGGHEVVAASPNAGVNTITGEGLKDSLAGAQVVIDLANAPSWEDKAVLEFFETSGRNLLAAEAAAG